LPWRVVTDLDPLRAYVALSAEEPHILFHEDSRTASALLMDTDSAFITGSDFLMDGGETAAYWFGDLAQK
jgi:hypothetical protein